MTYEEVLWLYENGTFTHDEMFHYLQRHKIPCLTPELQAEVDAAGPFISLGTGRKTFIGRVLAGEIEDPDAEVDDAIDAWHEGESGVPLHEFLGMTHEEYREFLVEPKALRAIIRERQTKITKDPS